MMQNTWVLRAWCEDVLVFAWVLRGPTKKPVQIPYENCHQCLKPVQKPYEYCVCDALCLSFVHRHVGFKHFLW